MPVLVEDPMLAATLAQSHSCAFSPEDVAMLTRAYAEGLDILGQDGRDEQQRLRLAKSLIETALKGERNEQRLCSLAVVQVLARPPHPPEDLRTN